MMKHKIYRRFSIILTLSVFPTITCLRAEKLPDLEIKEEQDAGYLTFFLDNDLFAGTDENYTNGGRISYITEGKPVIDIPFVQKALKKFAAAEDSHTWNRKIWGIDTTQSLEYSYGFALTQLMFTPQDPDLLFPLEGERPYAGWLGLGFSMHVRNEDTQNSVELSIGVVGKHSYAKQAQDIVHDLRNEPKFKGWDSQIPTEVTVNLSFEQRRRGKLFDEFDLPFDLEIDGFSDTGYSVGNYITEAHIGGTMRMGWNLPVEFSDPRLTISAHTQKLYSDTNKNNHRMSFYGVVGVRGTAVLHDITLDGPVFKDYDTGVDKEYFVGEFYVGFGLRYEEYEFGYVQTYRSNQYKTQGDSQSFGSIAMRVRF